jgi:hypothetical protein
MVATQSHAFHFDGFPAIRSAWEGNLAVVGASAQAIIRCYFTAVAVGIVEVAMAAAHQRLGRCDSLRAYEQMEWTQARMESWLVQQAYEGMLRSVECGTVAHEWSLLGKLAVAQLAESALTRLCRVIGGGTYAQTSSFGCWAEDVRALGFLRPSWGLAYDQLLQTSA